jgi:hypothetical protein
VEPCGWLCSHHSCPVVCGSVSRRSFLDTSRSFECHVRRFVLGCLVTFRAGKNLPVATNVLQVCALCLTRQYLFSN